MMMLGVSVHRVGVTVLNMMAREGLSEKVTGLRPESKYVNRNMWLTGKRATK